MVWVKMLQSNCDIHRKTASVAAIFIRTGSLKEGGLRGEVRIVLASVKRKGITHLDLPLVNTTRSKGIKSQQDGGPG